MQKQLVIFTVDCRTQSINSETITVETYGTSIFLKNIDNGVLYPVNSLGGVFIENGNLQMIIQPELAEDAKTVLSSLFAPVSDEQQIDISSSVGLNLNK